MVELLKTFVGAIEGIFNGKNPLATVLALFVLYLIYEIHYGRKRGREKDKKNDELHDKIEEVLRLRRGERTDDGRE